MTPVETISLLELGPKRIRRAAGEYALVQERVATCKKEMQKHRMTLMLSLLTELQGTKTNETQREGMLDERLSTDPHWLRLEARMRNEELDLVRCRLELEFERDLFDGARAISRILGGRAE